MSKMEVFTFFVQSDGLVQALIVETEFSRDENRGDWWDRESEELVASYGKDATFATVSLRVDQEKVRETVLGNREQDVADVSDDSMRLHVLFMQRNERYPGERAPEALAVITDNELSDAETYWAEEIERELNLVGSDAAAHKVMVVDVPRRVVEDALRPMGPIVSAAVY